ncbi:MAG: GNAT family N-acetyltransferase [Haloarculaceae archaeon]
MPVRPATPADRDRLAAVQATLAEPAPDLLAAALDGDALTALVVTDGGVVVGYALVVPGPQAAYLAELVVAPAHRGEGHGSALLSAVLDRAGTVRVVVRAADERARRFYEARGFEVRERLPDRFAAGDGLLLVRDGE